MPSDRIFSSVSMRLPRSLLRLGGRLNVPLYRISGGRLGGRIGRAPVMLLTTTGRRSGRPRTAPVLYGRDGEALIVIGSNAGHDRPPAWALNLEATPEATVEIRGQRREVRARIAGGDERERLWRSMAEKYEGFEDYRKRTERPILLFVLEPR